MKRQHLEPHFAIIGERKCGTSTLYRYLVSHPDILPCKSKEPQFFSQPEAFILGNFEAYLENFPTLEFNGDITFEWPELNTQGVVYSETIKVKREPGKKYRTGEASATYLCHADPKIVKTFLPFLRPIVLIRDPVKRAYSHYRMILRYAAEGREDRNLPIGTFADCIKNEIQKIKAGEPGDIVFPGLYINQIKNWVAAFGRDNILIIRNQLLQDKRTAQDCMDKIGAFLDLSSYQYGKILNQKFNFAPPTNVPVKEFELLYDFYEDYNQELEAFLGEKLNWTM